jgi:hypothetical protein
MIGTIFALSGLLLFMLAIACMDAGRALSRLRQDIEDGFGHDTNIFPDHE